MRIGPTGAKPHPAIVAEASRWFIEFRAGDVQGKTRDRFIEWLRRSPENIQAYLEVSGAWADLPTSDPEGKFDIGALVARARAAEDVVAFDGASFGRMGPFSPESPALRRSWRPGALSAAASLMLAIIVGGFYATGYFRGVYNTEIGEERTVALSDGSSVELNAQSSIRVNMTHQQRSVILVRGQAFFHVAKDSRRPFIVRAGYAQVRAVGTEFDVYRKSSETVVTVVEGRVETTTGESGAAGAEAFVLSAGEQLTVQPHLETKPARTDMTAATAWIYHRLTFEETPLSDVAEEFNRYNRRPLKVEDPEVKKVRISGVYSSTDPTSLIAFLRSQPSIDVIETADEVLIVHREVH